MPEQLKGGQTTEDPRLDRVVSFDVRSTNFPIRELIPTAAKQRSYTWGCPIHLDQGAQGACVGFGWTHELAASPVRIAGLDAAFARDKIYIEAQKVDEYPGEAYSGTSVLAGAKVATGLGYYSEYRWAFGLEDLILAVGYKGPAVLGINWLKGMRTPDENGYIHATGEVVGGHCILCRGVNIKEKRFLLHNSWGADWGIGGDCYISFDDMEALLHSSGEACVPVKRTRAVQ